ncbi:hypothetical protein [Methanobacterium formicicum]|uniref:Uncharacterized protein n=1 Tax=Methanobacterium formicicum (strain DSM 3637 / PP1) TaxID=1204725 RepID=K2REX0_METFP|nr:hypothetical protein [Methanobacterium formicicum]EKF86934.1 hypothetical protein A994_01570 [Methanobacterium formicicum DSM 3637]
MGDENSKKSNKNEIRYAIGTVSYGVILTNEMLIKGLKTGHGVIIINKDDLKRIMNKTFGFDDFIDEISRITEIMDLWQ